MKIIVTVTADCDPPPPSPSQRLDEVLDEVANDAEDALASALMIHDDGIGFSIDAAYKVEL
jgi:hypothetical protein